MSYDISIIKEEYIDVGNYTYNVSPMYYKAFGADGINGFNNMSCEEAIPFLEKGIKHMKDNPEVYKKLNPDNGWGNYEGALEYVENLLTQCKEIKNGRINIS